VTDRGRTASPAPLSTLEPAVQQALSETVAVIPVWNEEQGIGAVLDDLPSGVIPIVVDNGSTDRTMEIAREKGAYIVQEPIKGYGSVCMAGVKAIPALAPHAKYVTFMDGDHADHPEELPSMLAPVVRGEVDMVLGSRVSGEHAPGALPVQSRFAIWYARLLLWRLYRIRCSDSGPVRVMPLGVFHMLDMHDRSWGWTVEMQAKGARLNLRMREVPASYRKRPGSSKISGAFKTAVKAGWKILVTVVRWRFRRFDAPVWHGLGET